MLPSYEHEHEKWLATNVGATTVFEKLRPIFNHGPGFRNGIGDYNLGRRNIQIEPTNSLIFIPKYLFIFQLQSCTSRNLGNINLINEQCLSITLNEQCLSINDINYLFMEQLSQCGDFT